jgi:ribosomal protein L6P/L9E
LNLGFSHPVKIELPPVVKVVAEKDTKGNDILVFDSIDKQML